MEIIRTKNGDAEVVSIVGRLDTVTSTQLQTALADALEAAEEIMLDFAGVDYVSSAGLRVLLFGQKTAQASEKTMKLANVSSEVMEVFEITGFSGMLTIE